MAKPRYLSAVSPSSLLSMIVLLTVLAIVSIEYFKVVLQTPSRHLVSQTKHWINCGSSAAEARTRGCHFEILSFAWQTEECFDQALVDEFRYSNKWRFYRDLDGKEEVEESVAILGEQDLFVSWGYHLSHCTYVWRQMHRAYATRHYIDSHLESYNHTLHCQRVVLAEGTAVDEITTPAVVKYPSCKALRLSGEEVEKGQLAVPEQ